MADAKGPPPKDYYFKLPSGLTIEEVITAEALDNGIGFCMECGEARDGWTEPDACNYSCALCETDTVFGAQEIMLMVMF